MRKKKVKELLNRKIKWAELYIKESKKDETRTKILCEDVISTCKILLEELKDL